jgi:hypothetical protein
MYVCFVCVFGKNMRVRVCMHTCASMLVLCMYVCARECMYHAHAMAAFTTCDLFCARIDQHVQKCVCSCVCRDRERVGDGSFPHVWVF